MRTWLYFIRFVKSKFESMNKKKMYLAKENLLKKFINLKRCRKRELEVNRFLNLS